MGSVVVLDEKSGPVKTSWLTSTPTFTISTGQFAYTKLAASASTRMLCSLPEGKNPAPGTSRTTFCATSWTPVKGLMESAGLCSSPCNGSQYPVDTMTTLWSGAPANAWRYTVTASG